MSQDHDQSAVFVRYVEKKDKISKRNTNYLQWNVSTVVLFERYLNFLGLHDYALFHHWAYYYFITIIGLEILPPKKGCHKTKVILC